MQAYELRLWRKQMGWQQEQAAQALDISLRTYKRYETGELLRESNKTRKSQSIPDIIRRAIVHITLCEMLPMLEQYNEEQLKQYLRILLGPQDVRG